MPALQADIALGTRDAETVTWGSADVAARYPNARDGSETPATGYFDDPADAALVLSQRGGLIGVDRTRYAVGIAALAWPDDGALPSSRLVDAEHSVDATHLGARIEIDLEAETTSLELFG